MNNIRKYLDVSEPIWHEFAACIMAFRKVEPKLNVFPLYI